MTAAPREDSTAHVHYHIQQEVRDSQQVTLIGMQEQHIHVPVERRWVRPDQADPRKRWQHAIGRQADLAALHETLARERRVAITAAVTGMAGVGKSTLVSMYVQEYGATYEGGVLWADLGAEFRTPEQCQPILKQWARFAYGNHPQAFKPDQILAPDLVKAELGGQGAMLAVLDDIWHLDAIEPLRQALPEDCRILATTRDMRIAREMGTMQKLDVLTPTEALELLRQILPEADEPLLARLADILGRHPQALAIAGNELALREPFEWAGKVDELAELVRSGRDFDEMPLLTDERLGGHGGIKAALDLSYDAIGGERRLGPDYQRRFRDLGAFAPPEVEFDTAAAATLWGLPSEGAREALTEFKIRALVAPGSTPDRWAMHALVHAYAYARLTPEENAGAQERHRACYLERAGRGQVPEADVGQYLHAFNRAAPEARPAFFEQLSRSLYQTPALWISMRYFLVELLKQGERDLALRLAQSADREAFPVIQSVLVAGLQAYGDQGEAARAAVLALLEDMLALGPVQRRGILGQARGEGPSPAIDAARCTAIEAAYRLKAFGILEQGARSLSPAVRKLVVRRLWHLSYEQNAVFDILERLSRAVRRGWRPVDLPLLESVATLSMLIWFESYRPKGETAELHRDRQRWTLNRLKAIWRPLLARFFLLEQRGLQRLPARAVRWALPALVAPALVNLLAQDDGVFSHWLNKPEFAAFFTLDQATRDTFRRLIPCFGDPACDLQDARADMFRLAQCYNVLPWYLLSAIAAYHTARDPDGTIPLIKEVFDSVARLSPPPPAIALPRDSFRFAISPEQAAAHPEWLDLFRDMIWVFWDQHRGYIATRRRARSGEIREQLYPYGMLEAYLLYYYRLHGELDVAMLDRIRQKAQANRDEKLLLVYLRDIGGAISYGDIPMALSLQAYEGIWSIGIDGAQEMLVDVLASARSFDESEVRRFLDRQEDIPLHAKARILAEQVEDLTHAISNRATNFAMNALIVNPDARIAAFVRQLFTLAVQSRSLAQWLSNMLRLALADLDRLFAVE